MQNRKKLKDYGKMNEIREGIYDACIGHHDRLPAVINLSILDCPSLFRKREVRKKLIAEFLQGGSDNT